MLDAKGKPVPIGVPGELCLGGDGLARGYLHRFELTAERFIEHPFCAERGARLYRTGDRVRWLPDGNLEFLGRWDDQVKIRGFRIELGEIEAVLASHAAVRQCAVSVREDTPGDKRLAAYWVAQPGATATPSDLREHLRIRLPDYMVPAAFVRLEALPLNINGKVDRKALPAPDAASVGGVKEYVAPRTPVEEALAAIWAEVLRAERVGIHDNFFELGGHSLLAIRVMSRVQEVFGVRLALRMLFESPTVADLALRILHQREAPPDAMLQRVTSAGRDRPLPLSFAQQRLWFIDRLEPGGSAYHIPLAVRLEGPLNAPLLELCLNEIVRRHEVLRTRFPSRDGEPAQEIVADLRVPMPVKDMSQMPASQREVEVRRLASEELRRPFDLASGPLLRSGLLRLQEGEHVLLLTIHHIVSDGWSQEIFCRELGELYHAFLHGRPSPLPELPLQYADFAVWQREWLQGKILQQQLAYWKRQLSDIPSVLELPTDHPDPGIPKYAGQQLAVDLDSRLTQALRMLSRQEEVTLFMTLLAAWQVLLCRYSGQEDVVVGSPMAGRGQQETENLIGFFVNTLVLRTDLSGNPTFRELLTRVREVTLGAYAHQDLPFERLVEELQPERNLDRNPLFDVLINFVSTPPANLELAGLSTSLLQLTEPESKFSLMLYAQESGEQLRLRLVYRRALFSQERMNCLLEQFQYLLEQIVAAPEKPIRAYSLVTPESRALLPDPTALLEEPRHEPVTSLFFQWAERSPEHIAVRQGTRTWTYDRLAENTRALARTLVRKGLQPGDIVAVEGSKSFGVVVGMLGVWASRGVLMPVDPSLPGPRKLNMLRESGATCLIHAGDCPGEHWWIEVSGECQHLEVDRHSGCVAGAIERDPEGPLPDPSPDDAAYIFFTSGTTGTPKAILGCHKGMSHFIAWQRETFAIGPGDRIAQLTSLSFDVVLRDVLLPLTSGGTLCLPDSDELPASADVLRWLERERVSVIHVVPSLVQFWLSGASRHLDLDTLRWAFFAGEPLTGTLVSRWRTVVTGGGEIVNLYGPTETTLAKCYYRVPAKVPPGIQPIGKALPQTQGLILTPGRQLCGIGELGEIVVRTPFRTLGYLNASRIGAPGFAENPFRNDRSDRIYHTGDLGRYRPDGSLEILGRLDDQVKVRGVRVEPGEVEAVLQGHPAVTACTVLGLRDEKGEMFLAAYVVAPRGTRAEDLRSFLAGNCLRQWSPRHLSSWTPCLLTPTARWTERPCRRRRLRVLE